MPFTHEGNQFVRKRGNRREVLDGICYCTSGGLTADCLAERGGKIISKKRSQMGRERYATKNPFKTEEKVDEQPSSEDEKAQKVETKKQKPKKKPAPVKKKNASQPLRVPVARRRRGRARRGRRV